MLRLARLALALSVVLGTAMAAPAAASATTCFSFSQTGAVTVGDEASAVTTVTFKVTEACRYAVSYVAIGTEGLTRVSPANGSTYTSPNGNRYTVEYTGTKGNPGFESVKFTPIGEGYSRGSEVFTIAVRGYHDEYVFKQQGHAGKILETFPGSGGGE